MQGIGLMVGAEKSAWRTGKDEKKHEEKFISSGVWGFSRHPKYVIAPFPFPDKRWVFVSPRMERHWH